MDLINRLFGRPEKSIATSSQLTVSAKSKAELQISAQSIAAATSQQSAAIHESVASITQILSMLNQTNMEVQKSLNLTEQATEQGQLAKNSVDRLENAINQIIDSKSLLDELAISFQQMETKTKSINDIVLKTQICSFNASVEAARAGQYGKGFSIVADEVGRLAKITGFAAKEIDDLIKKSRTALQTALSAIFESVHSANEVNKTVSKNYTSFLDNIIHVHTSLDNVGKASAEQIQGLNQISKAIEQIEHASQESRQMAENINNLVRHLSSELGAPQKNKEPNAAELVNSIAQKSTEPPLALGADLQNISADDPSFKIRE